MPYRSPARWMAPLALLAALLAVFIIATGGDSGSSTEPTSRPATETTETTQRPRGQRRSTYTVRSGDVLSAIAETTGLTVQQLLDYNDDLDPESLRPGQKIRLTPPSP